MKTDCTPESDVGASARLTFSVELGLLLSPPPHAGSSAQDIRADARTDREPVRFISMELFTPLPPAGVHNLPMRALFRPRTTEQGLNLGSNASDRSHRLRAKRI